jgi:hypothetical protein
MTHLNRQKMLVKVKLHITELNSDKFNTCVSA